MKLTRELPKVKICYGYGIVFTVDLNVPIGISDEQIKKLAVEHFKRYMPNTEQVLKVDEYLQEERAWIEVEHEEELYGTIRKG